MGPAGMHIAVCRNQQRKDHYVNEGLDELAVVHGADTGNHSQPSGNSGTWDALHHGHRRYASPLQPDGDAGLAIDGPHHVTLAVFA